MLTDEILRLEEDQKLAQQRIAALIVFMEEGGRATVGDLRIIVPCVRLRFWERLTGLRGGRDLEPPEKRSLEDIERCYLDLSGLETALKTRE